jgi:hypothetical protein
MANTDVRKHGNKGAIYLGGAKGAGGTLVAAKAQWSLSRARDTVDVTSFGDTNKVYVAGLADVSGTYNGPYDTSGDLMLQASADDPQLIYLYSDEAATEEVAHGSGFIDATVTVAANDAQRIQGNYRASGAWSGPGL